MLFKNQPIIDFAAEMSMCYLGSCGLLRDTVRGHPFVFASMQKKTQTRLPPKLRDYLIK